jgi:DNA-binding NtrC family response regulator
MMADLSTDLAALCERHGISPPPTLPVTVDAPELPPTGIDLRDALDRFESALIAQALERTHGNRCQAARLLRMNRTTLVEKIRSKTAYSQHFRSLCAQRDLGA